MCEGAYIRARNLIDHFDSGSMEVDDVQACILIDTKPGKLWEVAEAAFKIEGAKMAHASPASMMSWSR